MVTQVTAAAATESAGGSGGDKTKVLFVCLGESPWCQHCSL